MCRLMFDNEDNPLLVYKPYVYATIIDCNKFYGVFERGKFKVVEKKGTKYEQK